VYIPFVSTVVLTGEPYAGFPGPVQSRRFDWTTGVVSIGDMIALMKDDQGLKMLPCREAAALYGCSMGYIRELARKGRVRSEMQGHTYFVSAEDIRALAKRKDGGRRRKRAQGFKPS